MGAHSSACSQGTLFRSSLCVAPPAPAAATAIGPRNTRLTAHRKMAHFSSRPMDKPGNQSSHQPLTAWRPGNLGPKRGLKMNRKKSRNSSRKRKPDESCRTANALSATIGLVQLAGGLRKLAAQQGRSDRAATVYDPFSFLQLVAARRVQDEAGHLLRQAERPWMTDTQPKAPEVRTGKGGLDVAQAVMARMAPALLQLDVTRQKIQFIVQHQHLFRDQPAEAHQRAGGLAGSAHVGGGSCNDDDVSGETALGHPGGKGLLQRETGFQVVGQVIRQPEAGIVAGRFVFGAGIAQAYDQAHGRLSHSPRVYTRKTP